MDVGWFRCYECGEKVHVETFRRKVLVLDGEHRRHKCSGYPDGPESEPLTNWVKPSK